MSSSRNAPPNPTDLRPLLDSWLIWLRAERKSSETLKSYAAGVRQHLAWCERAVVSPLTRAAVNTWVAELLDNGAEPATARARQLAVRRFSAWLAKEDEIDRDELVTVKPPKLDQKLVPELSEDQCRALIRACSGKGFRDRRDEAIVRFMLETACRAGDLVGMTVPDLDLRAGIAVVRRGKGGKGRRVPFGPYTTRAMDRYMRMRRGHRLADTPALWLGDRGATFGYHGLYHALTRRAALAGIEGFHPHVLRHTGAGRWLHAGGSEGGLMAVAGWTRREMIDRYTRATSERRAAEEAQRLNLGDL